MNDFNIQDLDFTLRDVKKKHITEDELDELKEIVGSYSELFNRRAQKYRRQGLNERDASLTESDYRKLILGEYTFLRRPIFVDGHKIAVGTSSKAMHQVAEMLA